MVVKRWCDRCGAEMKEGGAEYGILYETFDNSLPDEEQGTKKQVELCRVCGKELYRRVDKAIAEWKRGKMDAKPKRSKKHERSRADTV